MLSRIGQSKADRDQGLTRLKSCSVTDPAGQVRVTTQQQRSASSPVMEIMEQLADTSGQAFPTTQQVAVDGNHTDLADNFEATATTEKDRH